MQIHAIHVIYCCCLAKFEAKVLFVIVVDTTEIFARWANILCGWNPSSDFLQLDLSKLTSAWHDSEGKKIEYHYQLKLKLKCILNKIQCHRLVLGATANRPRQRVQKKKTPGESSSPRGGVLKVGVRDWKRVKM